MPSIQLEGYGVYPRTGSRSANPAIEQSFGIGRQCDLGFNRSMQRFGEIVQRVLRSLVFSWDADSVSLLWH